MGLRHTYQGYDYASFPNILEHTIRKKMKVRSLPLSKGFMWVADRIKHGKPLVRILDGFNIMHRLHPQDFYASNGNDLTLVELLYWVEEIFTEQPVKKKIEYVEMPFDTWVKKSFAYWWIRKQLRNKVDHGTIIENFNRYNSIIPNLFISWHGGCLSSDDFYYCLAFYNVKTTEQRNQFYRESFNDLEAVYKSEISSGWNSYPISFDSIFNTVSFVTPCYGIKTYSFKDFRKPLTFRAFSLDKSAKRRRKRIIRKK